MLGILSVNELPGAVELPAKYFYRVKLNCIKNVEVQIRRKRLIGSTVVAGYQVSNARIGREALKRAVQNVYIDFLDKTTHNLAVYFGDYK